MPTYTWLMGEPGHHLSDGTEYNSLLSEGKVEASNEEIALEKAYLRNGGREAVEKLGYVITCFLSRKQERNF
jgi:hypothetical protein